MILDRTRALVSSLCLVGVLGLGVAASASAAPAQVSGRPPAAQLTLTPRHVTVGGSADAALTATNSTSTDMGDVAMGLIFSVRLDYTISSEPAGAICRATYLPNNQKLVYCSVPDLPAGASVTLDLSITPPSAGRYRIDGYAARSASPRETDVSAVLRAG